MRTNLIALVITVILLTVVVWVVTSLGDTRPTHYGTPGEAPSGWSGH